MFNERTFPRMGHFTGIGRCRANGSGDVGMAKDQIYTGPERRRSQENIRALANVRIREVGRRGEKGEKT